MILCKCKECKNLEENGCRVLSKKLNIPVLIVPPEDFGCSEFRLKMGEQVENYIKNFYIPNNKDGYGSYNYGRYTEQFYGQEYFEIKELVKDKELVETFVKLIYRKGFYQYYKMYKISAIKMVKSFTGWGIKESKDFIDDLEKVTPRYIKIQAIEEVMGL